MAAAAATTGIGAPLTQNMYRRAPFSLGKKPVYLPSFRISLIHTPKLSPYYATFHVPLHLNKLDLRDYLWNAYNVAALSVSSRIQPQPLDRAQNERDDTAHVLRPAPTKLMTVRLDKPFVWPPSPSEEQLRTAFSKPTHFKAKQFQRDNLAPMRLRDTFVDYKEREEIRVQAKRLRDGRNKWRPPRGPADGSWAVRVVEK